MTATAAARSDAPASNNVRGWSRKEMAKRLADDIPEGWYINLGIGIPLMVGDHIPDDREVVQSADRNTGPAGSTPFRLLRHSVPPRTRMLGYSPIDARSQVPSPL